MASHTKKITNVRFPDKLNFVNVTFIVGIVGLAITVGGYFLDHEQFFASYLTSFTYFTTFALAALFFVMLQHITSSKWSVVVRRIPEAMASNLWLWGLFFIPVILGLHDLYHWTHADVVAEDKILQAKEAYLNVPFFIGRNVFYFLVWGFLGYKLYKTSVKMDETGDWGLQALLKKISAPGIAFFALSVAFASFDWLMSLDPHWFSTMFGVYFFAMSFQAFLALGITIFLFLRGYGILADTVNNEHIGDMGRLMFGFTVFYAYIAFCQFLLIYYANLPEETMWFYHRMEGNWIYFTYSLLICRFVIPFLVLLNRPAKSNPTVLRFISIWILIMHFVEMYWIVMPTFSPHGAHFHWLDLSAFVGLGGIFFALFFRVLQKGNLIPVNDPNLQSSLSKH